MNISKLNEAFNTIVKKQVELNSCEKSDLQYKALEVQIDELKSAFLVEYGTYLHEAIFEVHDEYCSDDEVKSPHEYIASSYLKEKSGASFDLARWEGVSVEVDDYPEVRAKLVLMPDPIRLELHGYQGNYKEIVWGIAS